jgi:hypothetical protein
MSKTCSLLFFLSLIVLLQNKIQSQGVTIGQQALPDPSAVLDLQTTSGGFLLPRLTTSERNAIVSPANGLQIYNVETSCVQIYMPLSGWRDILCDCASFPSAQFSWSGNPSVGVPVAFTSAAASTYQWSFQGGSPATSSSASPAVTWSLAGTYAVSLTASDALGCASTFTDSVVVSNCAPSSSQTFSYTGGMQQFVVPACVTQLSVTLNGAQGGDASGTVSGWANGTVNVAGGLGGRVQTTLTVTPGDTLRIYIGGSGNSGGYNGGGQKASCSGTETTAGHGGGASDIRIGGTALSNRVVVAGGGGGSSGAANSSYHSTGGVGGGLTGGTAQNSSGSGTCLRGAGGSQSAGGAGGNNSCWCSGSAVAPFGSLGMGGGGQCIPSGLNSCSCSGTSCVTGGGGGGGYYGGGAGASYSAGGGGSSYTQPGLTSNTQHSQGVQTGHGSLLISW